MAHEVRREDSLKKVQEYKDRVNHDAEELVLKTFPTKIVVLNELLETAQFNHPNLDVVHHSLNIPVLPPPVANSHPDGPNAKKRKVDCAGEEDLVTSGSVPCNKFISDLIAVVKPYIRQLVEDSNLLKMWISLLIPKIEDGNNFGVSIQEDILAEVRTVESEAAAFFDQISRYFMTRGKIVSKVAKYPHIEDYRRTVVELDEKEYLSLRLVLSEVRNHYSTLHDLIIKNMEKIKRPRNSNADTLY